MLLKYYYFILFFYQKQDRKEHFMKNYSRAVPGTGVIANETAAAMLKNGRNLFAVFGLGIILWTPLF